MHSLGIVHRDIKPHNLLVDPARQSVKICDLGSAKHIKIGEPNVAYVCARYYRAPELIFGSKHYSGAIDVWSAGCILAEFLLGGPLFKGESGIDQLVEIIKILGTPTKEQVFKMNPQYTDFKFPQIKQTPWEMIFKPRTPIDGIDLVSKILVYSPEQRLQPFEALMHPFFDEIRNPFLTLPNGNPLPDLFDFTPEEIRSTSPEIMDQLVPLWVKLKKKHGNRK